MLGSSEISDCYYPNKPILICPDTPTPKHSLSLSNIDDQKFLRFSIKYLYLFKKSINLDHLKCSLSKVLVHYYPLAGRLRTSEQDDQKLVVDCNGEGAMFAEAFMNFTADEFLEISRKPNKSWRKLLHKVEAHSFLDVPPLVIQVTNLRCGGMILCTAINHCLCDGIGTSQFLHAWAYITTNPNSDLPIVPFDSRHVLTPRHPPLLPLNHPGFTKPAIDGCHLDLDLAKFLQSQPLVPSSLTFTQSDILRLKRQCVPSLKCTAFEVLASHTWRSWVMSLGLSHPIDVKLLFSVNVRKRLNPNLPPGYYGNGFVLGCAGCTVNDLVNANLSSAVRLVQHAKSSLTDDYIQTLIDLLEDKTVKPDLHASLVISQWSKLGLEDLDFGEGKPLHMGPVSSDIYCLFLPVVGNSEAVRVLVSMPESIVEKFECYMKDSWDKPEDNHNGASVTNGHQGEENGHA
ncbi:hypothetical protein RJ641_028961 [Dillenia turbinata]|uniref:Omega-hydroxypalmitate O-feruloyl transferase n=1 Tax=Dillenia turbinata TaxID=194707 RepID=A0AAN8VSK3_9MAGN